MIKYLKEEWWDYLYGNKSNLNLAGKIVAIPMFPFVAAIVLTWITLDFLFSKKDTTNDQ